MWTMTMLRMRRARKDFSLGYLVDTHCISFFSGLCICIHWLLISTLFFGRAPAGTNFAQISYAAFDCNGLCERLRLLGHRRHAPAACTFFTPWCHLSWHQLGAICPKWIRWCADYLIRIPIDDLRVPTYNEGRQLEITSIHHFQHV